jgi:sulfur-oxidizing protein SoxY
MNSRRTLLLGSLATVLVRPALATPESMQAAMLAFTAGRAPQDGRVRLEIAELIDNGNAVPVSISVQSPMTAADHVQRIALLTERNPSPDVVVFHLGSRTGVAQVTTRMRLATSQTVTALALMNDGAVWRAQVDVIVTLAACLET